MAATAAAGGGGGGLWTGPLPSPPPPGPRRFAVAVANHYHMAAWQSFFSESAGVLLRRELGHASSQPHRAHPGRKNLLMTVAASIRGKNLGCASQPHSSPSRSAHHWHSASGVPLSNSRTAPRPPSGDSTSSRRCPQSRPATPHPPTPHSLEREYLERIGSRHRKIILGKQRTGCAARRRWEIGKRCVLEQTCKLQIQPIGKRKEAKRKVCMGVDM